MTNPLRPEQLQPRDLLSEAKERGLTIRDFQRLSGLSYGTARNYYLGITRNPSEATRRAADEAMDLFHSRTIENPRTIMDESPSWSAERLANLQPPRGSRFYRVVYRVSDIASGYASTDWRPIQEVSPLDTVIEAGIHPSVVARIVWERP